jgi:hypothetical protein
MTLTEIKETDWYKERPEVIQQAICVLPPGEMYMFKNSKKQCYIHSYDEPESGLLADVTVTVLKTGIGGKLAQMGLGILDKNGVFGVKLDDLEIYKEQTEDDDK